MPEDPKKSDQFEEESGDAVKDGGATTDRGRRDMGMPGPAPEAADQERDRGRSEKSRDRDRD